jgi:hypothetical protein
MKQISTTEAPRLLQDEAEGYETQRLSKWFASRIDARETIRRNQMKVRDKRYSIGNGSIVINDPRNDFDLWTVNLSDDPPVFWFWKNKEKNHIWDKVDTKDVPALVLDMYHLAIQEDVK